MLALTRFLFQYTITVGLFLAIVILLAYGRKSSEMDKLKKWVFRRVSLGLSLLGMGFLVISLDLVNLIGLVGAFLVWIVGSALLLVLFYKTYYKSDELDSKTQRKRIEELFEHSKKL